VEDELRARTDSTKTFYSAFAQAEFAFHERVKLTVGGRYDRFDRESEQENGSRSCPTRSSTAKPTSSAPRPR